MTGAELTFLAKWFMTSVEKHGLAKAAGRESEVVAGCKNVIKAIESLEEVAGAELKNITIHDIGN